MPSRKMKLGIYHVSVVVHDYCIPQLATANVHTLVSQLPTDPHMQACILLIHTQDVYIAVTSLDATTLSHYVTHY